jgi:hypothetical protein
VDEDDDVLSTEGSTAVGENSGWFLHVEEWVQSMLQQQKGRGLDWRSGSLREALQRHRDGAPVKEQ